MTQDRIPYYQGYQGSLGLSLTLTLNDNLKQNDADVSVCHKNAAVFIDRKMQSFSTQKCSFSRSKNAAFFDPKMQLFSNQKCSFFRSKNAAFSNPKMQLFRSKNAAFSNPKMQLFFQSKNAMFSVAKMQFQPIEKCTFGITDRWFIMFCIYSRTWLPAAIFQEVP